MWRRRTVSGPGWLGVGMSSSLVQTVQVVALARAGGRGEAVGEGELVHWGRSGRRATVCRLSPSFPSLSRLTRLVPFLSPAAASACLHPPSPDTPPPFLPLLPLHATIFTPLSLRLDSFSPRPALDSSARRTPVTARRRGGSSRREAESGGREEQRRKRDEDDDGGRDRPEQQ